MLCDLWLNYALWYVSELFFVICDWAIIYDVWLSYPLWSVSYPLYVIELYFMIVLELSIVMYEL